MEILVYLDDEDKAAWNAVVSFRENTDYFADILRKKIPTRQEQDKLSAMILSQKNMISDYWCNIINKYGILRDKQLTMSSSGEYIYVFGSAKTIR
jgi:hypothetical protein